jgi:hypothetical protein
VAGLPDAGLFSFLKVYIRDFDNGFVIDDGNDSKMSVRFNLSNVKQKIRLTLYKNRALSSSGELALV